MRPAGDKSWPIACSGTTLGTTDDVLDLSGASLSYGDFTDAEFLGKKAILLNGASLANAKLTDADIISAKGDDYSYTSTIDFTGANLANADLSGADFEAYTSYGSQANILFSGANLANADLSEARLTASNTGSYAGGALIDFTGANLANADVSDAEFDAVASYGEGVIDFTGADVAGADFSGATFEDEDDDLVGLCVDTFQNECDVSKCDKNTHKKNCKKTCNLC